MEIYERALCIVIGYAFGCFQTAVIVGWLSARIDIREHGSGNAGMANTFRTLGTGYGVLVFACDMVKAMGAIVLCLALFGQSINIFADSRDNVFALYAGLGVVLGHNFPAILKFRGGKGIASSVGIIICFDWRIAAVVVTAGVAFIAITRFVSVGSLIITGLFPLVTLLLGNGWERVALAFILGGLAYFMHRQNIKKLTNGTEGRFDLRSKGTVETKKKLKSKQNEGNARK